MTNLPPLASVADHTVEVNGVDPINDPIGSKGVRMTRRRSGVAPGRTLVSLLALVGLLAVLVVPPATATPDRVAAGLWRSGIGAPTLDEPSADLPPDSGATADLDRTDRIIFRTPEAAIAAPAAERLAEVSGGGVISSTGRVGERILELPADVDLSEAQQIAARMVSEGLAEVAEPDPRVTVLESPNDPYFPLQWGAQQTEMPGAWSITTGGSPGPVVAVLDTGVNEVSELSGRLLPGWNALNGSSDVEDVHGHGTKTATTLAAEGDNHDGIAGQCWSCQILPVKVLGDSGDGSLWDVAQGIVWAVDNGATVINLSLGGSSGSSSMQDAVAYAHGQGVTLVAAAGNDGFEGASYPAVYPEVISVGGSQEDGDPFWWSNWGSEVDVAAPGCNIAQDVEEGFVWYCGTSSAAPFVSGLLALRLATNPDDDPDPLRSGLMDAADPVGWVASGIVHGPRTMNHESATDDDPDGSVTAPSLSGSLEDLSASLSWSTASGGVGDYTYRLHRSTGSSCTSSSHLTTQTSRSYTDTGLSFDRTYRYCVRARDGAGTWSPVSGAIKIETPPAPPPPSWSSDVRLAFDLASDGVTLDWPAAKGDVAHYRVFRDGSLIATTSSTRRTVPDLTIGNRYHLQVRARDVYGQDSMALSIWVTPTSGFRDVGSGSTFDSSIRWLATGGITRGCNPPTNDRFCPDSDVTRGQMASFLVRGLGLTETSGVRFRDVPAGSTFEQSIDRLATAGITRGCNPPANDRFCPDRPVTRGQMAAFLRRALGA